MNFEASLLPVLGGYWLVTHLIHTRTDALRRPGYHTAFQSAFWGFALLVLAYPIALGVGFRFPALPPNDFELAAILSVPLGVVVPKILNRFFSQEKAERKIAEAHGDLVELLIAEAIDRAKLIEVSLSNGKSYIGLPFRSKITKWPESHVAGLPL